MNSLELATVYLAPKVIPLPPSKSLLIETHRGGSPPILVDGTHSSFLHIILHVRFLANILKSRRSGYDPLADANKLPLCRDQTRRRLAA